MPPKTPPPPIADVIKYGIIVLTAGIQIGMFYEMKASFVKLVDKVSEMEKAQNRIDTDVKILEVRVSGRRK